MNVRDMKAMGLGTDEKYSLGPQDEIVLKVKKLRGWFGKDDEHVGLSLEDTSGEWISAAIFNAPPEIAKKEGKWVPIRPSAGSMSGVWLEGEEYIPRQGPNAGKTVRSIGLKIMGGCFRWEEASSEPPQATLSPDQGPRPSSGGSAPYGAEKAVQRQDAGQPPALPLAEYQRWWLGRWEWYEGSPPIQRAIARGESVALAIRDAIGAEWMSQSPYERNIERTPYPGVAKAAQAPPEPTQGEGSFDWRADDPDDEDIPFSILFIPLMGGLLPWLV